MTEISQYLLMFWQTYFGTSNLTELLEDNISEKLLDLKNIEMTLKDDIITSCIHGLQNLTFNSFK
jgi:hypothetical protein